MSYKISPFTPVFWHPTTDKFGAKSKYTQTWKATDRILVQVLQLTSSAPIAGDYDGNAPTLRVKNVETGSTWTENWSSWSMNDWCTVKTWVMTGWSPGIYVMLLGDMESEPFCITAETELLDQTTLIQYSMIDNRRRMDTAFVVNGTRQFFDFRVPGGFKDDNWAFGVDNAQFTTSLYDTVDVHSHEMLMKTFTLGNSEGCPVWFADLLNRLLTCTYVYFDGVRYSRHESDVPEVNAEMEDLRSYIFTQTVQRVINLQPAVENANALRLRRVGEEEDDYRIADVEGETMNRMV